MTINRVKSTCDSCIIGTARICGAKSMQRYGVRPPVRLIPPRPHHRLTQSSQLQCYLFTISNSSLLFVHIAVTGFPFTRRLLAEKGTSSFRDFELWPITLTPELEGSDELPRQISKLKVILFKSYWLHEHTDTHWQTQQTDCAIGTAKWSVTYKSQSSLLSNTTANVCFAYRRLVRCRTFAFTERKTTNELINAGVFLVYYCQSNPPAVSSSSRAPTDRSTWPIISFLGHLPPVTVYS